MKNSKTYKITWGVDFNDSLYERIINVSTDLIDGDLIINCEGESDEIECEDINDIGYYIGEFINNNLSWITECDDQYVIGNNYGGDFVKIDLVD